MAGRGEAAFQISSDETTAPQTEAADAGLALLEQMLARGNMQRAWGRVQANKGAAGVDGLDILQIREYLKTAWPEIREQLRQRRYVPKPVRRVGIPKSDGGTRELGIPTVIDRLIQQALLQVLQPLLDPTFGSHSHGFRPGRRAVRCRRCSPMSCWMKWTRRWKRWVIALSATPTTATCTFAVRKRENE